MFWLRYFTNIHFSFTILMAAAFASTNQCDHTLTFNMREMLTSQSTMQNYFSHKQYGAILKPFQKTALNPILLGLARNTRIYSGITKKNILAANKEKQYTQQSLNSLSHWQQIIAIFNREAQDYLGDGQQRLNHLFAQAIELWLANLLPATDLASIGIIWGTVDELWPIIKSISIKPASDLKSSTGIHSIENVRSAFVIEFELWNKPNPVHKENNFSLIRSFTSKFQSFSPCQFIEQKETGRLLIPSFTLAQAALNRRWGSNAIALLPSFTIATPEDEDLALSWGHHLFNVPTPFLPTLTDADGQGFTKIFGDWHDWHHSNEGSALQKRFRLLLYRIQQLMLEPISAIILSAKLPLGDYILPNEGLFRSHLPLDQVLDENYLNATQALDNDWKLFESWYLANEIDWPEVKTKSAREFSQSKINED